MEPAWNTLSIFASAFWPFVKFGLWVIAGLCVGAAVIGWLQARERRG